MQCSVAGLLTMKAETIRSTGVLALASWAALPSAVLNRVFRDGTTGTIPVLM